jgi:hypothetical protein
LVVGLKEDGCGLEDNVVVDEEGGEFTPVVKERKAEEGGKKTHP